MTSKRFKKISATEVSSSAYKTSVLKILTLVKFSFFDRQNTN